MQNNQKPEEYILELLNEMQKEILKIGWNGVAKKYHPDVSLECNNNEEKFKVYKAIYEHMKDKLII